VAVISNFYPDGRQLAEYALHFVEGMREARGHERVTVLAGAPGPTDVKRPWKYGAVSIPLEVTRAVRKLQPDAVVVSHSFSSWGDTHTANFMGFLAIAGLAFSVPTVAMMHHLPQTMQVEQTGYRLTPIARFGIDRACRLLAQAHSVVFTLERDCAYFAQHYKPEGTHWIELGVPGTTQPLPWQDDARVLAFGLWGPSKDLETLVRVVSTGASTKLTVAGRGHWRFPAFLPQLQARYTCPQIEYTGYVAEEDLPALFGASWLVVLPYRENTGASAVLRQACKYGRAVLASDLPVFRTLAERLGLRLNYYRSEDELRDQLRVLMSDPARLQAEGIHNAEATRSISMSNIAERYWQLLESHVRPRQATAQQPAF